MFIIDDLINKAKGNSGSIVLPESTDPRVLTAVAKIVAMDLAKVTLLGESEIINQKAKALNIELNNVTIINPETSKDIPAFAEAYYQRRKEKGVTMAQAIETVKNPLYFGASMVKEGKVEGMVAGA
ncbi:MAG: phosphate acetyltransferase, partial [Candidatus Cloacimonas sp.]|nr:phosphate acetyltransferase [Candidatus Cloacimonas sp.]